MAEAFELIESVLFDGCGYPHLPRHLARLAQSARELGFSCNLPLIERAFGEAAIGLHNPSKVRLTLKPTGDYALQSVAITPASNLEKRVTLAAARTDSQNWRLRHKVSSRALYERSYQTSSPCGYYDVIFLNEQEQVTEGSFNNLFIRRAGLWLTPPVSCGVLPGIQRQILLESTALVVRECVLKLADLATADAIFLTNAVRGVVPVKLEY